MSVSRRLRYEILRRDDFACRYCGARAPEAQMTVDHVLPVALGGRDEAANLVAACSRCNGGKSSVNPDQPLVEQVSDDAVRWARAMREAAAIQGDDRYLLQDYRSQFFERWHEWTDRRGDSVPLPESWPNSLQQFYRAGLELEVILDLVAYALRSQAKTDRVFQYFCGCCWTIVKERQEIARGLLAQEEQDGAA